MAGVKKEESAGNQHLRSVLEEEEELAQRWTGQKQTRRAGVTVARVSRRLRLTWSRLQRIKKYQEKATDLTIKKSL